MKAHELRIGNYIDRNGLMEVRVISQSGVKIYDHINNIFLPTFFDFDENIKPIPLTEELIMRIRCRYHEDNLRMEFRMTPPGERQVENNYWSNEVHDFAKLHLSPSYRYELKNGVRVKNPIPEFWFIWITSCGTGSSWFMSLMDIRGHTLRYLHQLQNLYFDLTGKELTIK